VAACCPRLVTLSDPDFLTRYVTQVSDIPDDLHPPARRGRCRRARHREVPARGPGPDQRRDRRRRNTVELLRAVASAYGRGLPWGEIWPVVANANAIADRHGRYGDRDIADLLSSPISAYLITDQEDGTTVYRLFHDALQSALRTRSRPGGTGADRMTRPAPYLHPTMANATTAAAKWSAPSRQT
jgi:hypothetical protein